MSDILDIIHRITYETQGEQSVERIKGLFEQNANSIGKNTVSLLRLQKQLDETTESSRQAK
mgnify:CR=1 FL=1